MIKIKDLTVRNFMSVGNQTQAVDFNQQQLTLVLGENLDQGGDDSGSRNGTGKTTIINALSYALYGTALNNIKANNLINRTNGKGCLVTLEFEANGVEYRIERGRKPNLLRFFINGTEEEDNEAQGENKQTQITIEQVIGMSPTMFRNIVALNTYNLPFLAMPVGQQRDIIEQLLGITLLSEKAEKIKVIIKKNKEDLQAEDFKIKAIEEANKRVLEQIESLKKRARLWDAKTAEDINTLKSRVKTLQELDIEAELTNHTELALYKQRKSAHADVDSQIQRAFSDVERESKIITKLEKELKEK